MKVIGAKPSKEINTLIEFGTINVRTSLNEDKIVEATTELY